MKAKADRVWDVVVIGGGPAGMTAAARAALRGKSVLLLEKNPTLGRKLLITGGGRCNVTNNKQNVREILAKYKKNDKFLFSAFAQFSVADALQFFHSRGMLTKEENDGRIFPLSNSAQSVWDVLVADLQKSGVVIQTNATVQSISKNALTEAYTQSHSVILQNKRIDAFGFLVTLKDKTVLRAKACVVATGGTSRPETGSTGDGYKWMRSLGHSVKENDFALVPVALRDAWAKKLGGVTLQGIKITTFQNGQKQDSQKGKLLFTHFGLSGPTILNMSRDIGELLRYGTVEIALDLFPALDHGTLKTQLQALLIEQSNKKIKNVLGSLIPKALVSPLLELANIDPETPNHSVRSEQRTTLVKLLKEVPLHVQGLLGADKAVVSSGGVVPEEIDFKTMESRLVPNLYILGDMLNIDRPSGGYSLQLCWTTGFVAGEAC